jgi:hypothetical protein
VRKDESVFPITHTPGSSTEIVKIELGLTKRELMAALIMNGLISIRGIECDLHGRRAATDNAQASVALADALITALSARDEK